MKIVTLEGILEGSNINKAYQKVVSNKGCAGIDKMSVSELGKYLEEHWSSIKQSIELGSYRPKAVRRVG